MLFTATHYPQGNCTGPTAHFKTYVLKACKYSDNSEITFTGTSKFCQIKIYLSALYVLIMIFKLCSWEIIASAELCIVPSMSKNMCVYMCSWWYVYKLWENCIKKLLTVVASMEGNQVAGDC